MQIQLEVFGTLRDKMKEQLPGGRGAVEVPDGASVDQIASHLNISIVGNCVVMVNGQMERDRSRALQAGVKLTLIPPVAGGSRE